MKPQPKNERTIIAEGATLDDVITVIKYAILESSEDPDLQAVALYLGRKYGSRFGLLRGIYNFAYRSAYYVPDPPDHQRVKKASATLRENRGNCVDLSVLIGALLGLSNIRYSLRLIEEKEGSGFTHIYPVAFLDGRSYDLDLVPQQDPNGNELLLRPVNSRPLLDNSVKYVRKFDIEI